MLPALQKVPGWIWATAVGLSTVVAIFLGVSEVWGKIDTLVKGSVKQSTIQITEQILQSEQRVGGFFVDDIRGRIIVLEDEVELYQRKQQQVPSYLKRQLRMMEDMLEEAKEKWEE